MPNLRNLDPAKVSRNTYFGPFKRASSIELTGRATNRSSWWTLLLLTTIFIVNFIDRTILSSIGEHIRDDLSLSDTQLGLLGGFSFAVACSILGVPIAPKSARLLRKRIIVIGVVIWSLMTISCGFAGGFIALLIFRAGVGAGEAAFLSPAHAIISDLFPATSGPMVLSIFNASAPIGLLIGAIGCGWLVHIFDWRTTFMIVGLPGLLLAPLYLLTAKEPRRGATEALPFAEVFKPSLIYVIRHLLRRRSALHLIISGTFVALAIYSIFMFTVSYLIRRHNLNVATAASTFGIIVAAGQVCGMMLGGYAAGRLGKARQQLLLLMPAAGLLIAGILLLLAWPQRDLSVCTMLLAAGTLFGSTYMGPFFAALHGLLNPRIRATGVAIVLLITSLVGLGVGPGFVGFMSDHFAASFYAGDYQRACLSIQRGPGTLPIDECAVAAGIGLERALVVISSYILAAFHLWLASRNYENDLRLPAASKENFS